MLQGHTTQVCSCVGTLLPNARTLLHPQLRVGAAMVAGAALGLNRDLHGQPTGVRTLGIVGVGSAPAVLAVSDSHDVSAVSRVIQGILTGIGFLGAGVIFRNSGVQQVHGLTTAACTWLTACIGVTCGAGEWRMMLVGVFLAFVVLIVGGPLEKAPHSRLSQPNDD
jgi:putative Mg2+ transporter-C (MgtC) family protein